MVNRRVINNTILPQLVYPFQYISILVYGYYVLFCDQLFVQMWVQKLNYKAENLFVLYENCTACWWFLDQYKYFQLSLLHISIMRYMEDF